MMLNLVLAALAGFVAPDGVGAKATDGVSPFALRASDAAVVYKVPRTCEEGTNWLLAAAADLTNVLSRVTGKAIPLYEHGQLPATARPLIRLGDYEAGKLRRMAFRIQAEPGCVWIRANTGSAASYGVCEFLERFADFYFVSLNGDDDPVVANPGLTVPCCDFTKEPAVYFRKVYDGFVTNAGLKTHRIRAKWNPERFPKYYAFSRRTRCSAVIEEFEPADRLSMQTKENHSSYYYVPPEKHFKDHPEYFAYYKKDGKRHAKVSAGQICYSSEGALEAAYASLVGFIEADRRADPADYPALYDFTQQDHADFCECDLCEKVYAQYDQVAGDHRTGGSTAVQLKFMNRLARRVREKYPDVVIRTFAYSQTEALPPNLDRPEPNLMFWYCDLFGFSDHLTPLGVGPLNGPRLELLEKWCRFAPKTELWDYMLTGPYWDSGFPEVAADAIAADAKTFARLGVRRIFVEHYPEQPFWELNHFLYGQLLCDPEKDVEALVGKYCRVYGKAAPEMRAAIDCLRQATREHRSRTCGQWMGRALPWRNLKTFEAFMASVRAAWRATDDPCVRGHIAQIVASASREMLVLAKAEGDEAAYGRAKDEYLGSVRAMLPRWVAEPKMRAEALEKAKLDVAKTDVAFGDLPPELKDAKGLVMLDYLSLGARQTATADPLSESGKAFCQRVIAPTDSLSFGCYDHVTKEACKSRAPGGSIPVTPETADGKYHWHRCGNYHLGESSIFWVTPQWVPNWPLKAYHRVSDGLSEEEDSNWYEIWASVRFQGPSFAKGSAEPDGVWVDRIVLRRIDPPKKRQ